MAVEKTGCEAFTLCIAHILRDKDKHYFQLQIITKQATIASLACKIPTEEKVFPKKYPAASVKLKKTAIFAP